MKAFKRLKKTFRSFLVFVMVFLISGSSLNFAFATYGILVPHDPGSQTVNVDHIWVDKNNQYTEEEVKTNDDGSKEILTNKPEGGKDTPRPDEVEVDVIGTIGGTDQEVDFEEVNPSDPEEPADKIIDNGHTAGENAGKHDAEAGKENSGENAGYDKGFNEGYQEGNPPPAEGGDATPPSTEGGDVTPPPAEGGDVTPPPTEGGDVTPPPAEGGDVTPPPAEGGDVTPPAEGQNPPAESEKPGGPLDQLDPDVAGAIKDILATDKKDDNNVVIDNPTNEVDQEVKEDVDKITDELLDKEDETGAVRDQGNVWYESKDYVANVEVKEDGSKPPVTYEVELTDETKDALSKAGYETVQLKQTVETVFAVRDDRDTKYIDPYTGFDVVDPILAVCQHVSYDGGKTWQMVGEPVFRFSENGKPAGIYTPKDRNGAPVIDKNTGKNELTWDTYVKDLEFWNAPGHGDGDKKYDENGNPVDTENEVYDVTRITEYDASRDYVQETTYTFMHVLKEPEIKIEYFPNDPYEPDEPDDPETPEIPTQEVPEDPVPRVEPPEEEPLVDIPPEDVPLTTVPRTGDISSVWTMLALLSVTGLLGVTLLERKKANNS